MGLIGNTGAWPLPPELSALVYREAIGTPVNSENRVSHELKHPTRSEIGTRGFDPSKTPDATVRDMAATGMKFRARFLRFTKFVGPKTYLRQDGARAKFEGSINRLSRECHTDPVDALTRYAPERLAAHCEQHAMREDELQRHLETDQDLKMALSDESFRAGFSVIASGKKAPGEQTRKVHLWAALLETETPDARHPVLSLGELACESHRLAALDAIASLPDLSGIEIKMLSAEESRRLKDTIAQREALGITEPTEFENAIALRAKKIVEVIDRISGLHPDTGKKLHPGLKVISLNLYGATHVFQSAVSASAEPQGGAGRRIPLPVTDLHVPEIDMSELGTWLRMMDGGPESTIANTTLRSIDIAERRSERIDRNGQREWDRSPTYPTWMARHLMLLLGLPSLDKINLSGVPLGHPRNSRHANLVFRALKTWGTPPLQDDSDDSDVEHPLPQSPSSRRLSLIAANTCLTGEHALEILENPYLERVNLSENWFREKSEEVAQAIVQHPNLRFVNMNNTGLTLEAIEVFKTIDRPITLELDGNPKISMQALAALTKANPNVTIVSGTLFSPERIESPNVIEASTGAETAPAQSLPLR